MSCTYSRSHGIDVLCRCIIIFRGACCFLYWPGACGCHKEGSLLKNQQEVRGQRKCVESNRWGAEQLVMSERG